ncbi:DUF2935 domain-containing protein [Desulfuribacillus alkaliarsenatis]|nr:DUF2935 domain-containing protein [Desulfuribacillus alkaliarsenatis]
MDFRQAAIFEHQFWLQVLGDHARFIFNTLSTSEQEEIKHAHYFICTFDELLNKSRAKLSEAELIELTKEAKLYSEKIRNFKLHLIKRHLVGDIAIGLPPTFLNHMVTEVEEYLQVLCMLLKQQMPIIEAIDLHLAWLLDAAGHAAAVMGDADMIEKNVIDQSESFTLRFEEMYIKAVELCDYMRTGLRTFPRLDRFNQQVAQDIWDFKVFLRELEGLEKQNRFLTVTDTLMFDHMAREECYYLHKLAQVTSLPAPKCDPTQPRVEGCEDES